MSFKIKKRIFQTRNIPKLSKINLINSKDRSHSIPNTYFPKNKTFWHFIIQTTSYLENIGNALKCTLNSLNLNLLFNSLIFFIDCLLSFNFFWQ